MSTLPLPIGALVQLFLPLNAYPTRAIGTIYPYLTIREDHVDELRLTDHPVEQGANITDHSYKLPSTVTARYGWSNSTDAADGDPNYVNRLYNDLLTLQAGPANLGGRQPFTLITGKRVYDNMLITSLRTHTDSESATTLFIEAKFQQVIFVTTQLVSVPDQSVQKYPQTTAGVQNQGTQSLAPGSNYNPGGVPGVGAATS